MITSGCITQGLAAHWVASSLDLDPADYAHWSAFLGSSVGEITSARIFPHLSLADQIRYRNEVITAVHAFRSFVDREIYNNDLSQ